MPSVLDSASPAPRLKPPRTTLGGRVSATETDAVDLSYIGFAYCWGLLVAAIVSAVHADGKVTVWQLALAGPATSSQVLFQQQLDVRSLRVTKGVVQSDAASDGGVRVLVAVTTDGNTTAATLWHLDPQRREQPRSVAVESPPADGEMFLQK